MPLVPLMEGSSPLWIHTDEIFKPASIPQYPASSLNLLTRHSLGHNVQFSSINLSLLSYISACFTVITEILESVTCKFKVNRKYRNVC